ncbi:hypothetical protein [Vitreimonas sp.]|uniref:hypothetical protein n=1 Tax=Vitreimonas sp. TaxID=3069702 RepID=UPI002ED9A287
MRALLVAFCLGLAACSEREQPQPPTTGAYEQTASYALACATTDERCMARSALNDAIGRALNQPVNMNLETFERSGDFAWVVAHPRLGDGTAVDWTITPYAAQAREGALDADGVTYALLIKRENNRWSVLEFAIGPTDVAWLDWPERHGAPPELMGLPPT